MQVQVQLPLETIQEAANLYNRYQAGTGFRDYLKQRINPVAVLCGLVVLGAVALTAGSIVSLAGARAYMMLLVLLLAPVFLIGSVFVQALFVFGWLENRALAQGLKHGLEREGPVKRWLRKNLRAEIGKFPPVPWLFAAVFVLLPLALTAAVAPKIAAAVVVVDVAAFILFARLDR
jgi:hypothetical protein